MDFDKLFSGISNINIGGNINKGSFISTGSGTVMINGKVVNSSGGTIHGNGNVITKEFDIINNSLDTIGYGLPGTLEIKINPTLKGKETLTIEGEENILNAINVEKEDILELNINENVSLTKPLKIILHTSNIKKIITHGTGNIIGEYVGKKLRVRSSGTGEVEFTGNIETLEVSISGTGKFNGRDLYSKEAILVISGTSNAEIYATESAEISVSGIGNVKVYGAPSEFEQHVSGIGKIEKVNGLQKKF